MPMCKYTLSKKSQLTGILTIYCTNEKFVKDRPDKMCVCQKFCREKGYYIPHNQDKRHCKFLEDN